MVHNLDPVVNSFPPKKWITTPSRGQSCVPWVASSKLGANMGETIIITILVENTVHARGLLAEHGLSFHLQVGQRSLLFDTGQSDLFLRNALKLRLSLAGAKAIVLSHGHNDH